jgi:hypothetical protein
MQGSVLVWHHPADSTDSVHVEDLLYVAYRFPPHRAYFDVEERLHRYLEKYRHR